MGTGVRGRGWGGVVGGGGLLAKNGRSGGEGQMRGGRGAKKSDFGSGYPKKYNSRVTSTLSKKHQRSA